MTRPTIDILALPAGRELDAVVAEKVMQWTDLELFLRPPKLMQYDEQTKAEVMAQIPHYSTSISAAWEVVEKIQKNYTISISMSTYAHVHIIDSHGNAVVGWKEDDAPLAICRAALKLKAVSP